MNFLPAFRSTVLSMSWTVNSTFNQHPLWNQKYNLFKKIRKVLFLCSNIRISIRIDQNTDIKWNNNSCYQSEFLRPKLLWSGLHLSVKCKNSSKSLELSQPRVKIWVRDVISYLKECTFIIFFVHFWPLESDVAR